PISEPTASSGTDAPLLLPEHASAAVTTSQPEPVATALPPEDLEEADEPASAAAPESNPFLVPLKPAKEGGPPSLLPPPPILKSPSTPPPVPLSLRRTLPPSARPLAPPAATGSPSTSPPLALSGTIPPYPRMSLDGEIAGVRRARRNKMAMFAMLAAMLGGGYYARGKIGA